LVAVGRDCHGEKVLSPQSNWYSTGSARFEEAPPVVKVYVTPGCAVDGPTGMVGVLIASMRTVVTGDQADSVVGSREHLALALTLYPAWIPAGQDFWADVTPTGSQFESVPSPQSKKY
jgi:hypothetical protein